VKTVVVLAMHGAPPKNIPMPEVVELVRLHSRLEKATDEEREALVPRHAELDSKIRNWPRDAANDPFWASSLELAGHLAQATGKSVEVGFNEFCAPGLPETLDRAVSQGAEKVVVITTMMTRGGGHSEVDIAEAMESAKLRHPDVEFVHAWPFETTDIAQFLAAQIKRFA